MNTKKASFTVFMLVCISIFCMLGFWQIQRLHWKRAIIAELDKAYAINIDLPYVTNDKIANLKENQYLRGKFKGYLDFSKAFKLQGQIDNGKSTNHTIVPYIISNDLTILVDFGADHKENHDNGKVVITGLLRNAPKTNTFTPDNDPVKNIWYSIDPVQLKIGNLKPLVLLPEQTPWKKYPATKPQLRNNHLQYAIFWFTLAAVIAGLTAFYLKKISKTTR